MTDDLAQPLPEPPPPTSTNPPVEVTPELARTNLLWGWSLFGVFVLLFFGTFGVAFAYLWLD
jgi:hypothetical protein